MNTIELRCIDNGIRNVKEDGVIKTRLIAPMEFEARLYHRNDGQPPYFSGKGRTDAEAIGALLCHCPEKFNAIIKIEGE